MADKNKQSALEATLNAPVFVPGGKGSGKASNGKEASQKEKMPPAAAGAGAGTGSSKGQAASQAPAGAAGGSKAAPGAKSAPAGKLSAAAAAAPVFVPSGGVAAAANGGPPAAAPGSGNSAGSAAAAPSPAKGNSKQHSQQQQPKVGHQQQQQASQSSKAADPPPGIAKPAASAGGSAVGNSSNSSSGKGAGKADTAASTSSSNKGSGPANSTASTKGGAWGNAAAATNSTSSSSTAAPKMSAAAAAFVPGKAPAAAPGATPATATTSSSSSSAVSAAGKQAPASGQQAASGKGWNASATRSPAQQRPGSGPAAAAPTPSSNSSGPGRGSSGGRGAGGRGGRLDFGSGRGPMHSMQRAPMGGLMGGPGSLGGPMGTPRRGGGVGGPGTLASAQGQYMVPQGLYSAGPGRQLMAARFMSEALRQQLQQHNYLVQSKWSGSSGDDSQLPDRIGSYHSLAPLEELRLTEDGRPPSVLGVRSTVVKAISSSDGAAYVLRVINGKQVLPAMELLSSARQAVEAWSLLSGHPGLVTPREAFISSDMDGTPSLVVVYPYYPGDVTLAQAHLQPAKLTSGQLVQASPPSEDTLWSYTLQLAAALRAVHAAGLAVRPACLAPTKVLVSPLGQLRISCLGVLEALSGEPAGGPPEDLLAAQREDVTAMGQLLLGLACAGSAPVPPSVELAALHYSPDLLRLLGLLLGVGEGGVFSWRHLIALMGERALMELDTLNMFNNNLMADVRREMENGRLFRLLVKLGYINERPDGDPMASWSETGDRYLLKLFRDFVFHQVGEDGSPLLDWGHVVEALNKLDAGSSEEVLLMSRDEQVMLVVTYADIKRCAEAAYEELRQVGHGSGQGGSSYRS